MLHNIPVKDKLLHDSLVCVCKLKAKEERKGPNQIVVFKHLQVGVDRGCVNFELVTQLQKRSYLRRSAIGLEHLVIHLFDSDCLIGLSFDICNIHLSSEVNVHA